MTAAPDARKSRAQRDQTATLTNAMDRTSARAVNQNTADRGSDFSVPAVSRQPADALGPRAQRTIARIVEATREVFLTRGYAGTTIDEIARAADVSRASFYTYFPTKRDVLLTVGARSASDALEAIERLLTVGGTRAGLTQWVREYFTYLDVNGSFAFAWTQAAHEDEAIRSAGMKRHLALCRRFGEVLAESAGKNRNDTVELGLVMFSALERAWSYCHLYACAVDRVAIESELSRTLWAAAREQPTATSACR